MKRKALSLIGVFAHLSEKSIESLEAISKLHYLKRNGVLHYEGERIEHACFFGAWQGRVI